MIPDTAASRNSGCPPTAKRLIPLGGYAKPFPLCLLMLQKWAVRSGPYPDAYEDDPRIAGRLPELGRAAFVLDKRGYRV
jgi:hypothetical protein